MTHSEEEHHVVPYRLYVYVWAALMMFTVITVSVAYLDMKHVTVLTAMIIASAKAMLVILYFMHIRFEKPLFAGLLLTAFGTYAIFIGLTFVDYMYR
jgi:cytochrome c oxidase subunit 4